MKKYLLPTIITVIAIAVIAGFWLVALQLLVRKRTRELAEKNEMLLHAHADLEARVQERTNELAQSNQLLQADTTERKRAEKEIQTLARFPSENPNPVLRIARDGTLLYINQAGLSLLPEWHLQVGQSVPSMLKDVVSEALNSGSALLLDLEQRERVYSFFITPIANEGYTNMYGRDITDRKQVEEAMRESEERYRTVVENASDIVFRLDETGHITFVNPAALRIMGYEEKEIIGRHYPTFIRSDMQEEAMKFFGRQFVKGIPNTYSEYPVIVKDGREIWLGQNTQLIFQDGKVIAFQAVARDITDRKRMEEALRDSEKKYRELSIIDGLTQLYNSRHFYFQLKIELDRSNRYEQPLTLLLLDLDNFKAFNDAYGHVEGDQVLRRLGQVVKRCLRETDFAFRYGGEEFTILLPMTTSADGAVTAERIRTEFKKETFFPAPGQVVHVTVSIGIAQYKPQEEMKAFVHRVDQLMYQGKKNGKDRVCSEL